LFSYWKKRKKRNKTKQKRNNFSGTHKHKNE
jgi:hypothetical protein